ncbi:MAG TPA: hypothetical protein VL986_11790 [Terracidiphilus sp.]|nr:hypothetical protein [Terracidiphilus sp.]
MQSVLAWLGTNATVLAVLVTVGAAVLIVACLECSHCGQRDKDDIFKRHEV